MQPRSRNHGKSKHFFEIILILQFWFLLIFNVELYRWWGRCHDLSVWGTKWTQETEVGLSKDLAPGFSRMVGFYCHCWPPNLPWCVKEQHIVAGGVLLLHTHIQWLLGKGEADLLEMQIPWWRGNKFVTRLKPHFPYLHNEGNNTTKVLGPLRGIMGYFM